MNKVEFHNFYIKAKVELLEAQLPLDDFKKKDEEGNIIPDSTQSIPEYLADRGHTVERFSTDGYFLKGFNFNLKGLDELRSKLIAFGLIEEVNIWIFNYNEAIEELKKDIWKQDESI